MEEFIMLKKLKKIVKSERGFTLIEMVIVIAIMGILIAILLPNLVGFMSSSKTKSCEGSKKIVKSAVVGYIAANGSEASLIGTDNVINLDLLVTDKFLNNKNDLTCGANVPYKYVGGEVTN
jgi:type IV pilus assembly protein PilA